ncbi:Methyltransferase [Acidisarcina polymorpha]|uniref:Methyltransferase n=1 Tax=Acidisarcina polymorpha TaxID=2211140 RepID=A0A2Z5FWT7_9BACT|nr:class I SAM-dependent methyltransferase [Acidisarcina polymorpha]AXC11222.1 Methyltransferase [Acidisarcina polymorpha]
MGVVESLTPAEWAKQLANPEGEIGLAVIERVYESNAKSSLGEVAKLALGPGSRVLEIGFGNGRMAPHVIGQAEGVSYAGLDYSPTMVAEAERFNAALVAKGRASFHLGSAEHMPFPRSSFDCVFSVGAAHFWPAPNLALSEIRRVLRLGGRSLMGCLHPLTAPPFARPENGFYLREAEEWNALHQAAGFVGVQVETIETEQIGAAGTLVKRYILKIDGRA